MPVAAITNMAKKSDKTKAELEQYWKEAKKEAKKAGFSEDDDAFWAYTMGIVKRRAGLTKESIDEAYAVLKNDPVLRLHRIVEFVGDKASALILWESCKKQSLDWQKANKATKEATIDYAFSILETATYYPTDIISEDIFGSVDLTKKRKEIDTEIRKLLSKEEMAKLEKDGYNIDRISDNELDKLHTQLMRFRKKRSDLGFGGLVGTMVLGFVGGIAAAKAIDAFVSMFRTK